MWTASCPQDASAGIRSVGRRQKGNESVGKELRHEAAAKDVSYRPAARKTQEMLLSQMCPQIRFISRYLARGRRRHRPMRRSRASASGCPAKRSSMRLSALRQLAKFGSSSGKSWLMALATGPQVSFVANALKDRLKKFCMSLYGQQIAHEILNGSGSRSRNLIKINALP